MDLEVFRNYYIEELNSPEYLKNNPNFAYADYREYVANKMVKSIVGDLSKHDYFRYNIAMRRAAKRLGFKTTREFKDKIKETNNE